MVQGRELAEGTVYVQRARGRIPEASFRNSRRAGEAGAEEGSGGRRSGGRGLLSGLRTSTGFPSSPCGCHGRVSAEEDRMDSAVAT